MTTTMNERGRLLRSKRTIASGVPGPHLVVVGGVHGDEFEAVLALSRLADQALTMDPRGTLTVVPVVNEPALLRGTRLGGDGLDLARVCPGSPDGSVTERIAHELSELIRTADAFVDLHSGGHALEVLPFAGYILHRDAGVLETQRRMARAFNLPLIWGTGRRGAEGRTLSMARDAGVPAIYAEYGGRGLLDMSGVDAYVSGCLGIMAELGMIEGPTRAESMATVVEDPREGVANMQSQHPAAVDGLFIPSVSLGDLVRPGTECGHVESFNGAGPVPVVASVGGIVVVRRALPIVRRGEGLLTIADLRFRVDAPASA